MANINTISAMKTMISKTMGYSVKDVELDEKNGRGVFKIEAKRGSQEYEIFLDYPNLNVIKIKKD